MDIALLTKKQKIAAAFIDSLPVWAAYFPLGIAFGILWVQAGLPPLWAIFFSLSIYSGIVQFLAISFCSEGGALASLLLISVSVYLRNSFYVLSFSKRLPERRLSRFLTVFGLVDTSFALLFTKPESYARDPSYSLPLIFFIQGYWILGTAVGVWAADFVPPQMNQLDFALPALLSVLAMEQLIKSKSLLPAVIASGFALSSHLLFGQNWLFPAIVFCAASLLFVPQKKEETA